MRLTAALYDNLPEYARRIRQASKSGQWASRQSAADSPDVLQLFADFAESLHTAPDSLAVPPSR